MMLLSTYREAFLFSLSITSNVSMNRIHEGWLLAIAKEKVNNTVVHVA